MKRGKKLILLLVILLAAVGGYLLVSKLSGNEDKADKDIVAFSIESTDVTKISWTYLENDITLIYDRSNEKWLYEDDNSFPVDETFPQTMLTNLASITADRKLTDVTDFNEYGLDDPTVVISIVDSHGGTTKFTIGDESAYNSNYYMRINDESNVYLIGAALPQAFFHELNDIVAMDDIPYIDSPSQIAIDTAGKTNTLVKLDEDERLKYSYTSQYAWYYKQSENSFKPIDGDMAEDVITAVAGLAWQSCVDYNVTDEELETYGLKNPYATVTADYTKSSSSDNGTQETPGTFTLLIGNKTGDSYYAKLPDSNMVYLITAAVVDTFINTDYSTLKPKDVCMMDWNTVDSMDVTVGGETTTIVFNRTQSSSDDGKTTTNTTYTVGGSEADSEKVTAFLSAINGLKSENSIDNGTYSENGEPVIVFHRNTESYKTMTLSFAQHDSGSYLVSFNGEARLLVSKSDVESLKNKFNDIK